MAQINFRIDDDTKRAAEALFKSLGLSMSSAITVFINQSINERAIPFKVCAPSSEYHEKLLQAKRDWDNGRKNFHEHTDEEMQKLLEDAEKKDKRHNARPSRKQHARRRLSA